MRPPTVSAAPCGSVFPSTASTVMCSTPTSTPSSLPGSKVVYNTKLGTDVTLDELRSKHDAVFLGIGATLGRGLDLEGADADGVFKAIEFLINMNRGFEVEIGERVIVIGGGDVAMDAARTALRAADYESKSRR